MATPPAKEQSASIWVHPTFDSDWPAAIIKEFNIHPVTAHILAARGFTTMEDIHDYLYAQLPDLFDPQLFPDMDKAVDRVLSAIQNQEAILIYGDNDVDGMTATALLTDFLRFVGANVFFYIPNRNSLTQSVPLDALDYALANACKLLITVDCGITSAAEIEEFVKKEIDVIVTDHHVPTDRLPHCIATLNPKLLHSTYPNREITGVGVAFKLAHGVTNALIEEELISASKIDLKRYLDLVALGTIADMGALMGENRIFVRYGLRQLRKTKRIGLSKLFAVCELKPSEITPLSIASKVAPRLNSLGRIADPRKGVELLLIRDPTAAELLAKELDLNNIERQKIERKNSSDIEALIKQEPALLQHKAIILSSPRWHPGIIPILTARIAKQYNRPTVIISIDQGIGKGSIRTIPEFPLLEPLKKSAHLLEDFGGHDFAAGLTIKEEHIARFTEEFISAANTSLSSIDVTPKVRLDACIHFSDLTFDFMESFHLLEPFGNENPAPILYCRVRQIWPPKVIGKTHLKLYLEEQDRLLEGIAFGMAHKKGQLSKKNLTLEIACTPHINTFCNKASIQLQIRDFHVLNEDEGE